MSEQLQALEMGDCPTAPGTKPSFPRCKCACARAPSGCLTASDKEQKCLEQAAKAASPLVGCGSAPATQRLPPCTEALGHFSAFSAHRLA